MESRKLPYLNMSDVIRPPDEFWRRVVVSELDVAPPADSDSVVLHLVNDVFERNFGRPYERSEIRRVGNRAIFKYLAFRNCESQLLHMHLGAVKAILEILTGQPPLVRVVRDQHPRALYVKFNR
jgi:hypothetical protein